MKYNKAMPDSLRLCQFLKRSGAARRSVPSRKQCSFKEHQARTGEDWYPSMRLFRQKKAGDWRSVIDEIKTELRHKILCS
jgi:hypothetical protein